MTYIDDSVRTAYVRHLSCAWAYQMAATLRTRYPLEGAWNTWRTMVGEDAVFCEVYGPEYRVSRWETRVASFPWPTTTTRTYPNRAPRSRCHA